jgi:hypothetical protein
MNLQNTTAHFSVKFTIHKEHKLNTISRAKMEADNVEVQIATVSDTDGSAGNESKTDNSTENDGGGKPAAVGVRNRRNMIPRKTYVQPKRPIWEDVGEDGDEKLVIGGAGGDRKFVEERISSENDDGGGKMAAIGVNERRTSERSSADGDRKTAEPEKKSGGKNSVARKKRRTSKRTSNVGCRVSKRLGKKKHGGK